MLLARRIEQSAAALKQSNLSRNCKRISSENYTNTSGAAAAFLSFRRRELVVTNLLTYLLPITMPHPINGRDITH